MYLQKRNPTSFPAWSPGLMILPARCALENILVHLSHFIPVTFLSLNLFIIMSGGGVEERESSCTVAASVRH